jgi:hypothetical protein
MVGGFGTVYKCKDAMQKRFVADWAGICYRKLVLKVVGSSSRLKQHLSLCS